MWESEHGPRGGDEVNIPERAKLWLADRHRASTTAARSAAVQRRRSAGHRAAHLLVEKLTGDQRHDVLQQRPLPAVEKFAVYRRAEGKNLIRLSLNGDKVIEEERLLQDRGERIRDVRQGPDGYLYVLTDERDGKLLKVGLQP